MDQKCEATGKLCFSSPQEARKFASFRMHGARVRAYRCDTKGGCGRWHITREYTERNAHWGDRKSKKRRH